LKVESNVGLRETLYQSYHDPTGQYDGLKARETLDAGAAISTEFFRVYEGEKISKISDIFKVSKWMHTIEPTIRYRYIPRVDQEDLPVFDEVDRVPYTHQITYGITQRLLGRPEKEGISSGPREYGKFTVFQSYSLGDPFIDWEGKKRDFSNIQAELWWNFGRYVTARGNANFDLDRGSFDILNFLLHARDRRDDAVQVQYRYTRDNVKAINLDARVKTIDSLYLFGSFRYNLLDSWRVESIYGAEYQAQCWSVGFVIEDINSSPDGTQQKELKYQIYFNLLNIGSVGHKPYFMRL
jgi:LPS-assembly protein